MLPLRSTRTIAAACFALLLAACANDPGDRVRLYFARTHAPSLAPEAIAALDHLGPKLVDRGVSFTVYSERATRLEVLLFDDPDSEVPTRRFPMTRFGDVWSVHVEGLGRGQHYGLVAWGPNWPWVESWRPGLIDGFIADVDADGNRFNPNKLLIDPYARAVHRDHDWSRASLATGPARTQSTWGAAAKSVVTDSRYAWSEQEAAWQARRRDPTAPGNGWHEQIVYEVHLKGLTADPASGVENPGTYRGVAEMADYLADLGVTAVEFLPIFEKPLDGGYWGYHSLSWFAPETSYAAAMQQGPRTAQTPEAVIDEVKAMVDALHQRGIEVWIDVVYNHSGEGGLWREKLERDDFDVDPVTSSDLGNFEPKEVAGLYSLRGLDNQAYYALSADNQTYWYATGVGNQMRNNHKPFRRLTLDSLRYWAEELHIDGYRFDLAPALGAKDRDYQRWDEVSQTVLQDIIDDPVLQALNVRIVAEPWAAGADYAYSIGAFPAASAPPAPDTAALGWYEWNGRYRDWWRAFMNDDSWRLNSLEGDADGGFTMTGSDRYYRHNGRGPHHAVNFVTVHDGFTMYDVFTYDGKKNGCGPLNPVCCDDPLSVWCDLDSGENHNRSKDWGASEEGERMKRQLMRNLFVSLLISHGTPMLYGGDEWLRTQLGNNNAYSTRSDNPANWFAWGSWRAAPERWRMFDFVKHLIALRKAHGDKLAPSRYGFTHPFAWKSAANTEPPDWSSRHLMQHYYTEDGRGELLILINLERRDVTFTLPAGGRSWLRLVDTQRWFDGEPYLSESGRPANASANIWPAAGDVMTEPTYTVKDSSIAIFATARDEAGAP
jgi:isoamylase